MGQSPEELRRDIAQTREGLSDTLEAIGDRVSPGRVLERRKNRAVQGLHSLRDRVMGTGADARDRVGEGAGSVADAVTGAPDAVRDRTQGSPLAAGAVRSGSGSWSRPVFPSTRTEQDLAQNLIDKADPVKDELIAAGREVAGDLKDSAMAAVEEVKDTAAEGTQAVTNTIHEQTSSTKDAAHDAVETVRSASND